MGVRNITIVVWSHKIDLSKYLFEVKEDKKIDIKLKHENYKIILKSFY